MTRPSRKPSMRILGPPRSRRTPTHLAARCAASRTRVRRGLRSSTVPCEALRRTTSSPARIISVSTPRSSVAGPTVATIFVRRSIVFLPAARVPQRLRVMHISSTRALFQHRDGGQRLAFDELEKRSATGRDVRDAFLDAVLLDGRQRVAAAGEGECLAARDRLRDGAGALAELLELEHPDGSVPEDRARGLQQRAAAVSRVRTDVENHLIRAHLVDGAYV